MHPQIAILYNTFSAGGKGKIIADTIRQWLTTEKIQYTFYENDWPATLNNYNEVWVIGGDGTMNYFINQYPQLQIPIVLFAGGTGNDIHWKLYGKITLKQQFEKLQQYQSKSVDIGECQLDSTTQKYFINGVGIGFDGEVLKSMKTVRLLGGHLGYLLIVIKQILTFKETTYTITCNGESSTQPYTILNIANSSRTGGGFMVSPQADVYDRQLNLMACYMPSTISRLKVLPKVEKGKHLALSSVRHQYIQTIHVKADKIVHAQLDGELISAQQYDIKISATQLQIKH